MRLRLRGRDINATTFGQELTATSTIRDLRVAIEIVTKVPPHQQVFLLLPDVSFAIHFDQQTVKIGHPPKLLASDQNITLSHAGILDGENITLEIETTPKPENTSLASTPSSKNEHIINPPTSSVAPSTPASAPTMIASTPRIGSVVSSKGIDGIAITDGALVLREMEDDNSCLFRSVAYVLEHDKSKAPRLRQIVKESIEKDPVTYNEATLGRTVEAYTKWIQTPNAWGGAIELLCLSNHYQVEIDSIDVQTQRVDRFGEGQFDKRVMVLYSGIHYDALALALVPDDLKNQDFDLTVFDVIPGDETILEAGVALAKLRHSKHQFTDLGGFSIKCDICKVGLKGQKEAQQHAESTGHTKFSEYS
ncbi:hypothetical protein SmJEL517_g05647 [Synchytrium microbalum]|uniref:Ubiquitin thioesterase OTU n=1 Tax=Synchytrium microbalum TaxID=1806994 RepID=A0A507BK56_9FUNG|nr:uncharacterized protein SmJEL517_g05647 [Synchytrium microbalum]TPX30900.1 hypothetical protein SmJEL517_g05647 [Synchytrium microbalum]